MFKNIKAIFKREFRAYFNSPVAYVFLTAFLVLVGFLTFGVAMFYERRQADLTPFFMWHPWVYLLLVPAATMGSWADERRNGTAELLLTLPITTWDALVGKFLAAWSFIGIALALTFPVTITVGYLGSPDWGVITCGYLGSLLMAGAACAIGIFASTLSRSSVVGFVVALGMMFLLLLVGFDPVTGAIAGWGVPMAVVDGIASCSLLSHFEALRRGVVDLADLGYYIGVIIVFLTAAKTATDGRRGASKGLIGLAVLLVVVVATDVILSNVSLRSDLTADHLYTLSDGSKKVLGKLDKDVTFKYYFSSSAEEMPAALKTYAAQVEDLLAEYVRAGNGRLTLEKYDPKPYSDAEEWAMRYGIDQQQPNPFGAGVFFGIVAVCGDREEVIGTLSPRTESTLEYDLTRLVTRVAWPERPVVGLLTSLEGVLRPAMDPMMMQARRQRQGWAVFAELAKDYEVREIAADATAIDPDVKTLVVLHGKNLSDKTLYAIDQFVCRGGRLIACVDPLSVVDAMSSRQSPMQQSAPEPSTLGKLFEAWGVTFNTEKVTCDLKASTKMGNGQGGAVDEPAVLSLGRENMESSDLLVARLSEVVFPFAGAFAFDATKAPDLKFTPVISSSAEHSADVDRMGLLMGMGSRQARPDGSARVLAARLDGVFKTAFPQGPGGTNDVSQAVSEGRTSVLLFADSDFLADDFCVQLFRTPMGVLLQPMNDNLALFSNVIEQFAGREELIGIRSRSSGRRPFDVVDRMESEAMAKEQQQEADLMQRMQEAQQRITELQQQRNGNERMLYSREQQDEIVKFRKAVSDTRKELRNVRKERTSDIDSLGMRLKCLNIALIPLLVIFYGVVRFLRRK